MRPRRCTFSLLPLLSDLLFWGSLAAPGVPYGPHVIGGDAEDDSVSLLQSTADRWPAFEKASPLAPVIDAVSKVGAVIDMVSKVGPAIEKAKIDLASKVGPAIEKAKSVVTEAAPVVISQVAPAIDAAKSMAAEAAPVVGPALANLSQAFMRMLEPQEPEAVVHSWASGRGNPGHFSWSPAMHGPFELELNWRWQHPEGRFHTLGYGTAIDEQGNIYLSAADGMRKFTPQGRVSWEYKTLPAEVTTAGCLSKGRVYNSNTHGFVFALSMETGQELWSTKVSPAIGQDNGFVTVRSGIVVVASDSMGGDRNQVVRGLNASSGAPLWAFRPDVNVWNFMASFPGNDTLVFQDQTGKAYKLGLSNGTLLWKYGGFPGSWTDGTATLGMNGVLYTVYNNANHGLTGQFYGQDHPGTVCARDSETGAVLWTAITPRPPNNAPAVGRIYGYAGLSLVQPMGQQTQQGGPTDIYAYDADTGDLHWIFYGPRQRGAQQAGDAEGSLERIMSGVRYMCLPNPWSAPTIDASGTVFIGNQDGLFFALRDLNGDGIVQGPDEVSSYDTKAAFSGSAGPSLAENRVVVATCDSLFVFGA